MTYRLVLLVATLSCLLSSLRADDSQTRPTEDPNELRTWLESMVWHHRFSNDEVAEVTGLSPDEVEQRLQQWNIRDQTCPARPKNKVFVLPYPGGRHPRIGFLDGAIDPQRETKLSVFCPWDSTSYVVADFPEAIWSNLGLTYLAHTHVDTIWTQQGIQLKQQEWTVLPDGNLETTRTLPNGITFGIKVIPKADHLRMKMWLTNGTDETLTDLRVQNCVMLKAADGFQQQDNENKRFDRGYALAHSNDASRWVISGWDPVHRPWANPKCPCIHSDPKFADCAPGKTVWLRGWLSFYEGTDIDREIDRIESTNWRTHPLHHVTGNLVGKVIDADTKKMLPARLYVQSLDDQSWHFARSTAVAGSAIVYDKHYPNTGSIEKHTTLSADGFQLDVPPGRYRLQAFHGKQYLPTSVDVTVGTQRVQTKIVLKRFSNLQSKGWYSGDTHVHRALDEVPNVMLAEDLNVAFPLSHWVRDSSQRPSESGPAVEPEVQQVDANHLIYPVNTEYEIFSIDRKSHTQGAVFVINHRRPLDLTAPPVLPIAEAARRQGALLELDKHSWNWSLMIIPIMEVDLFELSNNHHWKTEFGFPNWTIENAPDWPEIQRDENGFTQRGWTEFGFQTYYGLLNTGHRMRVTAGTASGVHPVPLGYGRVFVHTGDSFNYKRWMDGLNAGHSFVTQGPLMDVRFNDDLPGTTWSTSQSKNSVAITGTIDSAQPLQSFEVIVNGKIHKTINKASSPIEAGGHRVRIDESVEVVGSSWVALRCWEKTPDGKLAFAHTNPVFVDVKDQPMAPDRRTLEFFIQRMNEEIDRNQGVITDAALDEYRQARDHYRRLLGE